MKTFSAIILGVLCSITVAAQSNPSADPLKPFLKCKPGSGFKFSERTRYVGDFPIHRDVATARGAMKVSVVDGYHVGFRFDDLFHDYARVKIDLSDPSLYLHNKTVIVSSLKYLSTSDQATQVDFTGKKDLNGFEYYGIDRDRIDVGQVVGTHVLFNDRLRLTVTIYLLNQSDRDVTRTVSGGHRSFQNIEQYRSVRDDLLEKYSKCLKKVALAQP